jgi:hypothetical protein
MVDPLDLRRTWRTAIRNPRACRIGMSRSA